MRTSNWISFIALFATTTACTGGGPSVDGGENGFVGCSSNADCLEGEVCANGECSVPLCIGSACDDSCSLRDDCPTGQICRDGDCIDPDGACESNEECLEGFVCDGISDTCVDLNPSEDAGVEPSADGGSADAGAQPTDGGQADSGQTDGGMLDAGPDLDAGSIEDAGGQTEDAGIVDAGETQPDAGETPEFPLCSEYDSTNPGVGVYLALDQGTEVENLAGRGNNFEQSCSAGGDSVLAGMGEDIAFNIYLDTDETIHFSVSVDTNADLLIYVIDDCTNPVCVSASDNEGGEATEVSSFTNTGLFQDFYIIVDEWAVSAAGLDYGNITFQYCLTMEASSCL
jgi:hypothetical protein